MRKIIVLSYLSLDGFTGSNGDANWIVWDDGVNEYYKETQRTTDTVLFGRTSFESLKNYWSTPKASAEDPEMIEFINQTKKIVFSKTLKNADWNNSIILNEIVPGEIEEMKKESGKDILIIGSGSVVSQLENAGLIDEYRFISIPVVLGKGKPYFQNLEAKLNLKLLETKAFGSKNVLLRYQPEKKSGNGENI